MRKNNVFRLLVVLVVLFANILVLASCGPKTDPEEPEKHVCEHVCEVCGKCTDINCTDPACQDKCQGHAEPHACNHVCEVCGKCLDQDCTDPACQEKCQGHADPHACNHVCEICGKCMDQECTDPVCSEKCQGHQIAAPVVTILENVISWEAVANASGYEVFVDGESQGVQTELSYTFTTEEEDTYSFTVKAIAQTGYQDSASSNEVQYTFVKEIIISFMYNDDEEIPTVYLDSSENYNEDEIEALLVSGVAAKDEDFNEYTVKVLSSGSFDAKVDGTYTIVLAAYDEEGQIIKNKNDVEYKVEREVIVKVFTKLDAPANVRIGSGNNIGSILFDSANGQVFDAVLVQKGKEMDDASRVQLELSAKELKMGFIVLESGDYTVYFKAKANGYKESDYSEGFDITYTCHKHFSAIELSQFNDHDHGTAELENGRAKFTEYMDNWGKTISEPFDVNMDKNPIISYDIYSVIGKVFSSVMIEGSEKSILGDTMTSDPVTLSLKRDSTNGYDGVQSMKLIIGVSGTGINVTNSTAILNKVIIFSIEEYKEPVPAHALANPSNIHTDGANIAWDGDVDAENYNVVINVKGTETEVLNQNTSKRSYEVATLAAGNYTITIKAIGNGTTTLDSEAQSFNFSVKDYANWNAEAIGNFTGEGWEATSTVKYDSTTGKAIINHDGSRDYGAVGVAVASAPTIDLSKKPVVVMTNVKVTGGFLAKAFFGDSSIIPMQNDTIGNNEYASLIFKTWINVDGNPIPGNNGTKDAPKGVSTYRFLMGFVSGSSSRVELESMRIVYVCDFSDTLVKCDTPSEFKPSGANIVWTSNALSYEYELYQLGSEVLLECSQVAGSQFNACLLPAGNYTLKVKGLGDGDSLSDSEVASYNFTVNQIVNYSASDIASNFELKGGNVVANEADGVVTIQVNNDSWGVWAAKDGVNIDLADKPVLVIDSLTLNNGCWLQRCFSNGNEVVMQNDTNGTFNNEMIVKQTWINVDGNPINENTGSKTEPKGEISYKVGIGVASNGSISLKGLRVVTLEEYKGEIAKLESPKDFAINGDEITWTGVSEEYTYNLIEYGTENVKEEGTTELTKLQVITLAAGDYTLEVVAVGDGVNNADSLAGTFNFSVKEYANWNAEAIGNFTGAGWEATSTVNYDSTTGKATINYDGSRGYGAVGVASSDAPTIDLANKPYVVMSDVKITTAFLARAFFGNSSIIVMQNDTTGDKEYDYLIYKTWLNVDGNPIDGNTGTKEDPKGINTYRFMMGFTSGNSSRVELSGMRIVYVTEYSEELTKCDTPTEFKAEAGNVSWTSNAINYSYQLFNKGEATPISEGQVSGSSFNAAILAEGTYTLNVKGLGDGESTSDGDEASYNFVVNYLANYSASDIASNFELKGGNVVANEAEGIVTIQVNGDSWGVWAAKDGVNIDLADKPVLVIDSLTLNNGNWLQRCYSNGNEVVMQNDTNGTFDNEMIVKQTWFNVDGNPINGNTGSKAEPQGEVSYKVGIGVANNGSISLKGLRVVVVSEFAE